MVYSKFQTTHLQFPLPFHYLSHDIFFLMPRPELSTPVMWSLTYINIFQGTPSLYEGNKPS